MKTITKKFASGKTEVYYEAHCSSCGANRGFVRKNRINQLCSHCGGKKVGKSNLGRVGPNKGRVFSEETKQRMSEAKQGFVPWNKGKREERPEVLQKISQNRQGVPAWNAGLPMDLEQKKKLSCANRGISLDEFDDFTMSENHHERRRFSDLGLHSQCFERDNHTCDKCQTRGGVLNAHHLNGWKDFPEERFLLKNLVTLCEVCHDSFHNCFGNGKLIPNTKEQYMQFKAGETSSSKKILYLLAGSPASGKSWVLSNLTNFDCIDSDLVPKKELRHRVDLASKPLLTLTIGISSFIKRNTDLDIKLITIVEDIDTLNQRMIARGGKITPTIERRAKRMTALAKQSIFSGTSQEVLKYLRSL